VQPFTAGAAILTAQASRSQALQAWRRSRRLEDRLDAGADADTAAWPSPQPVPVQVHDRTRLRAALCARPALNYRLKNLTRGKPEAALMHWPAGCTALASPAHRAPRVASGASGPPG